MCDLKLITRVDHITIEEPNEWTLVYSIDKKILNIVRSSKPYVDSCGDINMYVDKDIDVVNLDRLKTIISRALEHHTDPGTTGGFILRDITTGRKVIVKYNNTIRKMVKLTSSPHAVMSIFDLAAEIVSQAVYDNATR